MGVSLGDVQTVRGEWGQGAEHRSGALTSACGGEHCNMRAPLTIVTHLSLRQRLPGGLDWSGGHSSVGLRKHCSNAEL